MIEAAAGLLIGGYAALKFSSYQPAMAMEDGALLLLVLSIVAVGLMRRWTRLFAAFRELILMSLLCAGVFVLGNAFGMAFGGALHIALIVVLFLRAASVFVKESGHEAGVSNGR